MKTKILLVGILLLFIQSCGHFDTSTVDESSSTTTATYLQLSPDSFELCSAFYEGVKEFSVVIAVDVVDNDGNIIQNNYDLNEMTITNDDSNTSTNPFRYEINVPETGSYIVSITYSTTDCFVCCSNSSCNAVDANGMQWSGGKPLYRGLKMLRNQSAAPSEIIITLEKQCF